MKIVWDVHHQKSPPCEDQSRGGLVVCRGIGAVGDAAVAGGAVERTLYQKSVKNL